MSIDSVRITLLEKKVEDFEKSLNQVFIMAANNQNKVNELTGVVNNILENLIEERDGKKFSSPF